MDTGINGTENNITSIKRTIEALEFKLADALFSDDQYGEKLYHFQIDRARKGLTRLQPSEFMEA